MYCMCCVRWRARHARTPVLACVGRALWLWRLGVAQQTNSLCAVSAWRSPLCALPWWLQARNPATTASTASDCMPFWCCRCCRCCRCAVVLLRGEEHRSNCRQRRRTLYCTRPFLTRIPPPRSVARSSVFPGFPRSGVSLLCPPLLPLQQRGLASS